MSHEEELIHRARLDDREAFCELARSYQRRIYALALHFTRDPHNAEDLSQEVWLKAYRSIATFRGESSFYTWLRQIAIHTFMNSGRHKLFRFFQMPGRETMVPLDEVDAELQVDAGLNRRLLIDEILRALGELSPKERLIFLLKHQEGMTYDEIAVNCGVSAGTIKKALFRTVGKLRTQMGIDGRPNPVPQFLTSEES